MSHGAVAGLSFAHGVAAELASPGDPLALRLVKALGFGVLVTALLLGSGMWRRRRRRRRGGAK